MKKYTLQNNPFVVPTTDGKLIEEHHGLASTNNPNVSIAHMIAPPGWSEPFQTPEFDEYTYIISGKKQFIVEEETIVLEAGQSIKIEKIPEFNIPTHLRKLVNTLLFVRLHLTLLKYTEKKTSLFILK